MVCNQLSVGFARAELCHGFYADLADNPFSFFLIREDPRKTRHKRFRIAFSKIIPCAQQTCRQLH
jgi:hypothetical protein